MEKLTKTLENLLEGLRKAKIIDMKSRKVLANLPSKQTPKESSWMGPVHDGDGKRLPNQADAEIVPGNKHAARMSSAKKAEKNPCQCHDCVQFGLSKHPEPKPIKLTKAGQWYLDADKIEPGKENSRKLPKEEK